MTFENILDEIAERDNEHDKKAKLDPSPKSSLPGGFNPTIKEEDEKKNNDKENEGALSPIQKG